MAKMAEMADKILLFLRCFAGEVRQISRQDLCRQNDQNGQDTTQIDTFCPRNH